MMQLTDGGCMYPPLTVTYYYYYNIYITIRQFYQLVLSSCPRSTEACGLPSVGFVSACRRVACMSWSHGVGRESWMDSMVRRCEDKITKTYAGIGGQTDNSWREGDWMDANDAHTQCVLCTGQLGGQCM